MPAAPSLLIVPYRSKTGKLYSQIPTSGAGDFTVTRNTEARRFNSAGLIESVASGIPRLDYYTSGGTAGCPALLVEPSAANLKPRSDDWTNSAYTLTRVTQNQSVNVAPLTKPMLEIRETAVTGTHSVQIQPDATLVSGSIYTRSYFVSLAGRDVINFSDAGQGANSCRINLSTKAVVSQEANIISSRIVDYGNGLFLVSVTFTATSTIGRPSINLFEDNTTSSYLGDITKGVNIHFIQYELGSVDTSYIPNANASGSVTRSADVISVSGAVSGSIGQTAGVVYAQVDLRNWTASGRVLAISDGTSDARVVIQVGDNQTLQAVVTAASGEVANIATASGQVNGIYKCAVAYASGDFAFYVNGNQIGTDSSGAVPACNNVALGKIETSASTNFLNDRILAGALYNTRLTNAELATLTTL